MWHGTEHMKYTALCNPHKNSSINPLRLEDLSDQGGCIDDLLPSNQPYIIALLICLSEPIRPYFSAHTHLLPFRSPEVKDAQLTNR